MSTSEKRQPGTMLKFVAEHVEAMGDGLQKLSHTDRAYLFDGQGAVAGVDGELGPLILLTDPIIRARTRFHDALRSYAGETNMTALVERSDDRHADLYARAVEALRIYSGALEAAEPALQAADRGMSVDVVRSPRILE